jgi:hypothetical protein
MTAALAIEQPSRSSSNLRSFLGWLADRSKTPPLEQQAPIAFGLLCGDLLKAIPSEVENRRLFTKLMNGWSAWRISKRF